MDSEKPAQIAVTKNTTQKPHQLRLFHSQVVCCPGGLVTGFTRFIPNEEQLESSVITRAHMEGQLVVALAGRSAPVRLAPCDCPAFASEILSSPHLACVYRRPYKRGHIPSSPEIPIPAEKLSIKHYRLTRGSTSHLPQAEEERGQKPIPGAKM